MLLQISFSLADALNLRTEIGTLEAMGVVGGGYPILPLTSWVTKDEPLNQSEPQFFLCCLPAVPLEDPR